MKTISVTIAGTTPLLMNRFTDAEAEKIKKGTSNAVRGKSGTPRERATEKLYSDENGVIHIPGPNIFRAIIDAGTFIKNGKSKVTTQKTSIVPAGMSLHELA